MSTMADELDALLEMQRRLEDDSHKLHSQPWGHRDPNGNEDLNRQQRALTAARVAFLKHWSKP